MTTAGGSAIVIPGDALLDSGKEQIVFVGQGDGYFEPRHVKAGRRVGDEVQILEGIKEGELVATGAAFFLDSESQLHAATQGYEATAGSRVAPAAPQIDIAFRVTPNPPRIGDNQMEVVVKDAAGKPVDGADVAVQFFMAGMPTMNMPAMRNETKLAPAGGGVYRGHGQVMMAGQWQATVTVTRGGQRLGSKQLPLVAR
jgi:nitrogen fixation protein FixH